MLLRIFLFPFPSLWYWSFLWAVLISLPAVYLARKKNRSIIGWTILCGITAFFFGTLGLGWLILLATRKRVSMRMKYLSLKFEEQIADALKMPSPVGDNLEKRLLMVLAYNPEGLRIGALAQGIGQDWRHIEDLVQRLVSQGKIRKTDDRYLFNLD